MDVFVIIVKPIEKYDRTSLGFLDASQYMEMFSDEVPHVLTEVDRFDCQLTSLKFKLSEHKTDKRSYLARELDKNYGIKYFCVFEVMLKL